MSKMRKLRRQHYKKKKKISLVPLRIHSKKNLPHFVLRTHAAVEAGKINEANRLLKENSAKVTEELSGNNPLRTNVMFVLAEVLFLNAHYSSENSSGCNYLIPGF